MVADKKVGSISGKHYFIGENSVLCSSVVFIMGTPK